MMVVSRAGLLRLGAGVFYAELTGDLAGRARVKGPTYALNKLGCPPAAAIVSSMGLMDLPQAAMRRLLEGEALAFEDLREFEGGDELAAFERPEEDLRRYLAFEPLDMGALAFVILQNEQALAAYKELAEKERLRAEKEPGGLKEM